MPRRLMLAVLTFSLSLQGRIIADPGSTGTRTAPSWLQTTPSQTAPSQALPRCEGPEYRQFDFWIGEWDVRPANQPDSPPMSNVITKEDDGCVIRERWQGARMTGQSVNIYDRTRGKWHQTWVDSTGGLHAYWGTRRSDGAMAFEGEQPPRKSGGPRVPTKLTFFPLGEDKVRQLAESSSQDAGKTWTVTYDLIYTRRKR
jgi:hypothetical protein